MIGKKFKTKNIITALILCGIFGVAGKSYGAIISAASCSQADVRSAIASAAPGDMVKIPAGACTWGLSSATITVNKAITVQGAGADSTIITIDGSGSMYGEGAVVISAAATVGGFTIQTPTSGSCRAAFSAASNGFRITNVKYLARMANVGYFVNVGNAYGLIDNCYVQGGDGTDELIFTRGPDDSWQTADSFGGADNVFIENNTFTGFGYVTDINSNGRAVVRYNTISGPMKIDGHGIETNTPARSFRQMEIYNNRWTDTKDEFWRAIEIRGGTVRIFNNVIDNTGGSVWVLLHQYASESPYPGYFNNACQCPSAYPIKDQVGLGMDPKVAHSDPAYLWNNTVGGAPLTLTIPDTSGCSSACGGAFSMEAIIQSGRDYFLTAAKPAAMTTYVPYACPHPLVGSGSCSPMVTGTAGYSSLSGSDTPPAAPTGLVVN